MVNAPSAMACIKASCAYLLPAFIFLPLYSFGYLRLARFASSLSRGSILKSHISHVSMTRLNAPPDAISMCRIILLEYRLKSLSFRCFQIAVFLYDRLIVYSFGLDGNGCQCDGLMESPRSSTNSDVSPKYLPFVITPSS